MGSLDHSPADVLRWMLVRLGLGSDPTADPLSSWPVYVGSEPPAPDLVLTLYDTQGRTGQRTTPDGERDEFHGFQIRIRSATYAEGFARARLIAVALDEDVYQEHVHIGDANYVVHAVTRTGDVTALGKESPTSKRSLFTLNGVCSLYQL